MILSLVSILSLSFPQRAGLTLGTEGQGFVRYPSNNSEIRAVSAVHQLHCLVSQKPLVP